MVVRPDGGNRQRACEDGQRGCRPWSVAVAKLGSWLALCGKVEHLARLPALPEAVLYDCGDRAIHCPLLPVIVSTVQIVWGFTTMNEILKVGMQQGFVKGVREAPRQFFVPAVVAWRGVKFVFNQIETAMVEANGKSHHAEYFPIQV